MEELFRILAEAKSLAIRYSNLTGKPLGITGEVAEFEAARLLGINLANARQAGYDATRERGGRTEALQIKGRCFDAKRMAGQLLGSIRLDHPWDFVLLVLLDKSYEAWAIYEASRSEIELALSVPGSKARSERGALAVSKFISIGKLIWSKTSPEALERFKGTLEALDEVQEGKFLDHNEIKDWGDSLGSEPAAK